MKGSRDRRSFLKTAGKAGSLVVINSRLPWKTSDAKSVMQRVLDEELQREHPRLHLNAKQWKELRQAIADDPLMGRWFESLQTFAERLLDQAPVTYHLIGPRLLTVSRTALRRIELLAGLYRIDGDTRKSDRARAELKAICGFPSWHPAHFLDVAEMTNGAALGYDWLYEVLSEQERTLIRTKIIEFGLRPGLAEYEKGVSWSQPGANNWGQVCAGGLTMGALAIANDVAGVPEPAAMLEWTTTKVRNAMTSYAPDGGWPEGPGYWLYATRYTCAMISALNSALGRDFDLSKMPGFAETGTFRMASIGPTGKPFNYADAPVNLEPSPEMFWLAERFERPMYAANEISMIAFTRPTLSHLLWFRSKPADVRVAPPPLDVKFSRIDMACFRASWTDGMAFFVGFKGGSNMANHGHLDLGTFVMDALGERWALDLGSDDYDLPGYFGAQRWDYYRLRSEGHNTPTLGVANQSLTANAPMSNFVTTASLGMATVDLTEAYRPELERVTREISLERSPRQRVIVTDKIVSTGGQALRWNMHTQATIQAEGMEALLHLNGKHMRVTITSPAGAKFTVISASAPKPQAQQTDVSNLIVNVDLAVGSTEIRIVFDVPDQK